MEIWMNGNLRAFVTNKVKAQGILDYVSYFHVHKEYSKSNSPSVSKDFEKVHTNKEVNQNRLRI